jgi:tetratricopeptide (TPR) repeat protein
MNRLKFALPFVIAVLLIACGANKEKNQAHDKILSLETELLADSLAPIERLKAQELIQAYENYVETYPEDSLSPEYLYKSSEIAMNLQMSGRAIEGFKKILVDYPDFDKADVCIFLQAFIYENHMQQYDTAKELYQEFLEKYPSHDLAEDALVSIQNMGKSLEELIKSWEGSE